MLARFWLDVLDLGYFTSIQSLQHQSCPTNTNDLIKSVEDTFYALMKVMESVMLAEGKNSYNLPHMGKYKMLRAGTLPKSIKCSDEAIDTALEVLDQFLFIYLSCFIGFI